MVFPYDPDKMTLYSVVGKDLAMISRSDIDAYLKTISRAFNVLSKGYFVFLGYAERRDVELPIPPVEKDGELYDMYRMTVPFYRTFVYTNVPDKFEAFKGFLPRGVEAEISKMNFLLPKRVVGGIMYGVKKERKGYGIYAFKVYPVFGKGLPSSVNDLGFLRRMVGEGLFSGWRLYVERETRSLMASSIEFLVKEYARMVEKRPFDEELRKDYSKLMNLKMILSGEESLATPFSVTLSFLKILRLDGAENLSKAEEKLNNVVKERHRKVVEYFKKFEKEIDLYLQGAVVSGYQITWWLAWKSPQLAVFADPRILPKFFVTNDLIAVYYPFASESPDMEGIYLGFTGSYYVYVNPFVHRNYNWVITGSSGSGKSVLMKYIVYVMYRYYVDMGVELPAFVIIDPQAEYDIMARLIGADYVMLNEDVSIGLDPVRFYKEGVLSRMEAVESISGVTGLTDDQKILLNRVFDEDFGMTMFDLSDYLMSKGGAYEEIGNRVKYYTDLYGFIFDGEFNFRDRVVYAFQNMDDKVVDMIIRLLVLPYWSYYVRVLPRSRYKMMVIDEVQKLMSVPFGVRFVQEVYSTARKYNVSVITATQSPITYIQLQNRFGLNDMILINSNFKVFLPMDKTVIPDVAKLYGIPIDILRSFASFEIARHGRGIVMVDDSFYPVNIELPRELIVWFGSKEEERRKAIEMLNKIGLG